MKSSRNLPFFLMAAFAVLLGSWALPLWQGSSPIKLGLDLAGGVTVTYRPDFSSRLASYADLSEEELLNLAKETLKSRLYRHASSVPDVVIRGDQRIVVSLPSQEEGHAILEKIGKTYHLTFRLVEESFGDDQAELDLHPYQGRFLHLAEAQFSGDMLDDRAIRVGGSQPGLAGLENPSASVEFQFRSPHDEAFAIFTEEHVGREMAILLDGSVEWSGRIESAIRDRGLLQGSYDLEEASEIAMLLRSGSLPISLEVESLTAVGPSLGQELKDEGTQALLLALVGLVLILILAYQQRGWFLLSGLASLLCLLFLIFSLVSILDLHLDLVGIAGLILSIGMGMDAFILVFEALDDRLQMNAIVKHPRRIVRAIYGYANEGRVLLHANATTLLVISLLLATDRLKSFAVFILVGILASVVTILITRQILQNGLFPKPSRPDLLSWMRRRRWNVFRWRKAYFALVLIALISLGWNTLHQEGSRLTLGKDFQAGTQLIVGSLDPADLDLAINDLHKTFPDVETRRQRLGEEREGRFMLTLNKSLQAVPESRFEETDETAHVTQPTHSPKEHPPRQSFNASRLSQFFLQHDIELESVESIDSRLSSKRLLGSLSVLLLSFFLLALYFVLIEDPLNRYFGADASSHSSSSSKWMIFCGVLLAVLSDLILVLALLAVLSIPISLAVVAGLLTVVGYSVNDSVVLWNHVLKQARLEPQGSAEGIVSASIDRLLSRALLTSLSTMVPALTILLVDLEPLRDFAWVILVGAAAGTLSSLFIVGTLSTKALKQSP